MATHAPDATITLRAELVDRVWTVTAVPPDDRSPVVMGVGARNTGIMIPTTLFDQLVAQNWTV